MDGTNAEAERSNGEAERPNRKDRRSGRGSAWREPRGEVASDGITHLLSPERGCE